jgi:hypothetical protein
MVATWLQVGNRQVALPDMLAAASNPATGLLLANLAGLVHVHVSPDKGKPTLRTVIYNPGGIPDLSCLAVQDASVNLFPTTYAQWKTNMWEQMRLVNNTMYIQYPAELSEINDHLHEFRLAFEAKVDTHLLCNGLYHDVESNPHHITTWALFLQLHLNLFQTAVLMKDTSLLVTLFDKVWTSYYAPKFPSADSKTAPRLALITGISINEYRCGKCWLRGNIFLCCVKCGLFQGLSGQEPSAAPHVESPADTKWWTECSEWKRKHKDKDGNSPKTAAYEKAMNTKAPVKSRAKKVGALVSVSGADPRSLESYIHHQNLIKQHVSYDLY